MSLFLDWIFHRGSSGQDGGAALAANFPSAASMAANVVTDGAGAAAGAAVAQQQQLGVREVLAALDPTAMLLLIITLLSFLLPVIVLYPPVPATISDALRQSHRKLGLDFDGSDKQVSSGPATAKKRPFSSAKKGTAAGAEADAASTCTVQGITIYPVKSCAGIRVSRARVTRTGLQFDRLFTFAQLRTPFPLPVAAGDVDAVVADDRASNKAAVASSATESAVGNAASDGKVGAAAAAKKRGAVVEEPDVPRDDTAQGEWHFVTQRQFPLLATVSVDVWLPDMARSASMQNPFRGSRDAGAGFVVLRFPSPTPSNRLLAVASWCAAKLARGLRAVPESEILLPLEFPDKEAIAARGYKFERITIWKDTITALNVSSEIPDELARYLGISNRLGLFRIDPNSLREVYRCAPRKEEAGYQPVIGFQDGVSALVFLSRDMPPAFAVVSEARRGVCGTAPS